MSLDSEITWNIKDIEKELTHLLGKIRSRMVKDELSSVKLLDDAEFSRKIQEHKKELSKLPINAMIDHTLLSAQSTETEIEQKCNEAIQHSFKSVCVNSRWIAKTAAALKSQAPLPISVVGFPLGSMSKEVKVAETRYVIDNGAQEVDMVISIGDLKSQNFDAVFLDIAAVVEASKSKPVKVIIETAYLSRSEKIQACLLSAAAKAQFVKTSTGFATPSGNTPNGATPQDVKLMSQVVWGSGLLVKASGGIRTQSDALRMLQAGASRLGTSNGIQIIQGDNSQNSGHY
jgi:deoxyribose-phosphate aldolase